MYTLQGHFLGHDGQAQPVSSPISLSEDLCFLALAELLLLCFCLSPVPLLLPFTRLQQFASGDVPSPVTGPNAGIPPQEPALLPVDLFLLSQDLPQGSLWMTQPD